MLDRMFTMRQITDEDVVAECYFLRKQLKRLKETLRDTMNQPVHALPFLSPGRLARVREGDTDWGWGVVVNYQKKFISSQRVQP